MRPPENRTEKMRSTGSAGTVELSGSRVEGRMVAWRGPPSFGKMGHPRMGMTSYWARRFITLQGLSEAPGGAVGYCVVGKCVASRLRVPDMESTRNRTPEAEGRRSERAIEPRFVMCLDPYYTARDGTPQAEDQKALSSPLFVSWSASWRVAKAGTHNAQPGPVRVTCRHAKPEVT